jgi:intracellular multiplication protein IcmE
LTGEANIMSDHKPSFVGRLRHVGGDHGSRRLFLLGGTVIAVGLIWYIFAGGPAKIPEQSHLKAAPTLDSNTLTKAPDPRYVSEVDVANKYRADSASRNGGSAMPTAVRSAEGAAVPSLDSIDDEQPMRPVPKTDVVPPRPFPAAPNALLPPVTQQPEQKGPAFDSQRAEAMKKEMEGIAKLTNGMPAETTWFFQPDKDAKTTGNVGLAAASQSSGSLSNLNVPLTGAGSSGPMSATAAATQTPAQAGTSRFTEPAPSTILYARLIGKVNSDVPGPVVAEVLQGAFTHSRILGSFQFSEQGVLIKFDTMTVPYTDDAGVQQTETVPIHAVAVDSKDLGTAMFTDIDRHLLQKIGVGAATAFMSGFGQALAQSGATTTVNPLGGSTVTDPVLNTRQQLLIAGGAAASNAGNIFQQYWGNRRTTVTVDADTPFGLLFLGNSSSGN